MISFAASLSYGDSFGISMSLYILLTFFIVEKQIDTLRHMEADSSQAEETLPMHNIQAVGLDGGWVANVTRWKAYGDGDGSTTDISQIQDRLDFSAGEYL